MENDDPSSLAHTKIAYVDAVEEKDEDADDDQVAPYLDETPEEYKCDSIQILAIQRLVSMTSDLITTFPKQSSLVPQKDSTDWIESLILFYYFASVAADWHLIMDSEIRNDIKTAFRCMIDAFSIRHWKGLPPGAPDENGSLDDVNTVANDITEAIAAVAMFDGFENYRVSEEIKGLFYCEIHIFSDSSGLGSEWCTQHWQLAFPWPPPQFGVTSELAPAYFPRQHDSQDGCIYVSPAHLEHRLDLDQF